MVAVANAGSCVGPQIKIGHSARRHRRLMQAAVLNARGIYHLSTPKRVHR